VKKLKKCPKGLGHLLAFLLIVTVSMASMCILHPSPKKQTLEMAEFSFDKSTIEPGEGTLIFFVVKSSSTNTKNINLQCTVLGEPENSIEFDKKDFQAFLKPGETTGRTRIDILWTNNGGYDPATINVTLSVVGTTEDGETIFLSDKKGLILKTNK